MIKGFRSSYGLKLQISLCMFKTDALIKHWTPRLLNKFSLVRNPMSLILEFSEVLYIFMCRKRKEANWVHMGERSLCGL